VSRRKPMTRSQQMARVRQRDTKPELMLRKALWAAGRRYRKQAALPGRPDLAFPGARLVVFVDGCYWHGCPRHYSSPATNRPFWVEKLRGNTARDLRKDTELEAQGWRVLHIWECEVKGDLDATVARVHTALGIGPLTVAEPARAHGEPPWFTCACGCQDVVVLAVSGPGSLNIRARKRPASATLRCRRCQARYEREVG
jgi:DNA mismatch endonuclease, patch repair protein